MTSLILRLVAGNQVLLDARAKFLVAERLARDAQHDEVIRQQAVAPQVVEGRNELALRQVARRAEDHHGARRRRRGGACIRP